MERKHVAAACIHAKLSAIYIADASKNLIMVKFSFWMKIRNAWLLSLKGW